jgi:lysine 6-dehydrogenase
MKYAVLGAGLMGKAVAYDLLQQDDTREVILTDNSKNKLAETSWLLGSDKLKTELVDAKNSDQIEFILDKVDAAVAAIHYGFNTEFTRLAIATKIHLCDLGGNNDIVDEQMKMHDQAKQAGVSIIPDCGLAPGMISVLIKWGLDKFDWIDTVKARVGGLPQKPTGTLKYGRLFSVEGLINEYIEPVRVLRDGKLVEIEPLSEIEELEFPQPYGKLEAFSTSGGLSTLVDTYGDRLKNLDYKTIRYPGHGQAIRAMYELGLFSSQPQVTADGKIRPRALAARLFEENIPLCDNDVTLVRIIFEGKGKSHSLTIIDNSMAKPPLTAMMRTTAFPAAIISQMQARGIIDKHGVLPQEKCVPTDLFIAELKKRNIMVEGV